MAEMASYGMSPARPEEIKITNGKWVNYSLTGDRGTNKHGAYRLTCDDLGFVGQFKDRRSGDAITWASKDSKKRSPEEKLEYKNKIKKRREEDEKSLLEQYSDAAKEAKKIWKESVKCMEHPYLTKKGVQPYGARINSEGYLILPRYDFSGDLWGTQTIDTNGEKRFQYNAKASGTFMLLADPGEPREVIIFCEGYATGASIREATKLPVMVCFTAGNLLECAMDARKKYPESVFIFASDNDKFTFKHPLDKSIIGTNKEDIQGDDERWEDWEEKGFLYNTGVSKSKEAAYKTNGKIVVPTFAKEYLKSKPTDFNDYHKIYGLFAIKELFDSAIKCKEANAAEEIDRIYGEMANYEPDNSPQIDWAQLVRFRNHATGELDKKYSLHNASVILTHKPPVNGCFVYDDFIGKMTVIKPLPWDDNKTFSFREVDNNDVVRLMIWFELQGINLTKGSVLDVVSIACNNRKVNPATDYLDSLKWDGKQRLNNWLCYYIGAENQNNEYLEKIGSCWLMAAVKRIYRPGTPFHHMLVLEGGQGAQKSMAFGTLATFGRDKPISYFSNKMTFEKIGEKDFAVYANGNVILEFQELSGFGKQDIERIKQWITQEEDEYRLPHDKLTTKFPRKFVIGGTINRSSDYLTDPTGGRRFWPVTVGNIDIKALENDREQLWAEAVARVKAGEQHYISPDDPVYKIMVQEQGKRFASDPWSDLIECYCERREEINVDDIFIDCLGITDKARWDRSSRARICDTLISLGYENIVSYDKIKSKTVRKWRKAGELSSNLFEVDL